MDNLRISDNNHPFQTPVELSKLPSLLSKISNISHSDPVISALSAQFEILDLQLGDSVYDINEFTTQIKDNYQDLYLITQGKIRLVSAGSEKAQNLSIQLLEKGVFLEVTQITVRPVYLTKHSLRVKHRLQRFLLRYCNLF